MHTYYELVVVRAYIDKLNHHSFVYDVVYELVRHLFLS